MYGESYGIYKVYQLRTGRAVALPKAALDYFGWSEGDPIIFSKQDGKIFLKKVEDPEIAEKYSDCVRILRRHNRMHYVSIPHELIDDDFSPEWVEIRPVKLISDDDRYHALVLIPLRS